MPKKSLKSDRWLAWGQRLQALAQDGLAYSQNLFDIERYEEIQMIAAEMISAGSELEVEKIQALFSGEMGYATPKLDVRGAAFRENKILLVREMLDGGRWTLPGGWMDPGDSPGGAAVREFREETGYKVRALKLAAIYERNRHGHPIFYFSTIKLFFLCELIGGSPASSKETGESGFFGEDELPELSLPRVTSAQIHMLFKHLRQPQLPTEFDTD
jgi:ADP-ribose pyrophosphatase YjhB (NUDIX family)